MKVIQFGNLLLHLAVNGHCQGHVLMSQNRALHSTTSTAQNSRTSSYSFAVVVVVAVVVVFWFFETRFLFSPSCLGTHNVDQAGLEFTEIYLSVSASPVLELKMHTTTPSYNCLRV